MAARKPKFYVYRIFDRFETVYVGKGSGRRLEAQMSRFGLEGSVIESCESEDCAFERERHWIDVLKPTYNKTSGGDGGRTRPKPIPSWLAKAMREYEKFLTEYNSVGPQKWVAQFLLQKVNEVNCEQFGITKATLGRLKEVAYG